MLELTQWLDAGKDVKIDLINQPINLSPIKTQDTELTGIELHSFYPTFKYGGIWSKNKKLSVLVPKVAC